MLFRYLDTHKQNVMMRSLGMECVAIESEIDLSKEIRKAQYDGVGIIYVSDHLYDEYKTIIDSYNSDFNVTITVLDNDSRLQEIMMSSMGINIDRSSE